MVAINMTVNGKKVTGNVSPTTLLVEFIRENLNLTGTHVGCDTSQCGACVIHVNGQAVKSCTMLALQANDQDITTIEGLAAGDTMHPMQEAFKENHGLQCGFCTPGMVMTAVDLAQKNENLDNQTVRKALEGNICRCTGYNNIVKSVIDGAEMMKNAK